MPKGIGYAKDYLHEYERQAMGVRKKKIREQVRKNLGLVKKKPIGKSFKGFMGSSIGFK